MSENRPVVFIGTLGLAPQVITLALDNLYTHGGVRFAEVCVIHTDESMGKMKEAVAKLDTQFSGRQYGTMATTNGETAWQATYAYHNTYFPYGVAEESPLVYRRVRIERLEPQPNAMPKRVAVQDVETQRNSKATYQTIFRIVDYYKQHNAIIHFCIAGGRKSMAVFGLAVAHILFEEADKLWHLFSTDSLMRSQTMHKGKENAGKSTLVPIDLIYLREYLPVRNQLMVRDPYQLMSMVRNFVKSTREDHKTTFLQNLDAIDRDILVGVCQLLESEIIGQRLQPKPISKSRVSDRLTRIRLKYLAHLDQHGIPMMQSKLRASPRPLLIAEFASYFERRGEQLSP